MESALSPVDVDEGDLSSVVASWDLVSDPHEGGDGEGSRRGQADRQAERQYGQEQAGRTRAPDRRTSQAQGYEGEHSGDMRLRLAYTGRLYQVA